MFRYFWLHLVFQCPQFTGREFKILKIQPDFKDKLLIFLIVKALKEKFSRILHSQKEYVNLRVGEKGDYWRVGVSDAHTSKQTNTQFHHSNQ